MIDRRGTVFAVFLLLGVMFIPSFTPAQAQDWRDRRDLYSRVNDRDLRSFEEYLDSHWETAQELYRDPELINDRKYLRKHDALDDWLDAHSEAAREIQANPRAFLWRARKSLGREERDPRARVNERDLRSFEKYLSSHEDTARELYRNPDLINDRKYVRNHDALDDWLDDHPEAAREIRANPRAFFSRQGSGSSTQSSQSSPGRLSAQDLQSFETYLNTDWRTSQELYQSPDLINDRRFVRSHPDLEDWLQDHPEAAAAIQANPHKILWRQRATGTQDFLNQLLRGGR